MVVGFRSTGGEVFRSTGGEVFRSTGGEGLAKVKAEPSALPGPAASTLLVGSGGGN